ncbi:MAG: hypothetical protein UT33_C0005G0157 [Candidatus Peregrinibacteria bacterium GW2011_GWC2_39_14]|nr:MAG: hypothetical protein US92_C0001G0158 [Candidatus Peregrinibacteria bacterium GW2011_GWA2_38_36]KKR07213.1 MAG: hypothetical protein UT33_C0005G0157 [Candidatus Peregrinibacteria bacterium GW2011_GWC2_39_14]
MNTVIFNALSLSLFKPARLAFKMSGNSGEQARSAEANEVLEVVDRFKENIAKSPEVTRDKIEREYVEAKNKLEGKLKSVSRNGNFVNSAELAELIDSQMKALGEIKNRYVNIQRQEEVTLNRVNKGALKRLGFVLTLASMRNDEMMLDYEPEEKDLSRTTQLENQRLTAMTEFLKGSKDKQSWTKSKEGLDSDLYRLDEDGFICSKDEKGRECRYIKSKDKDGKVDYVRIVTRL